MADVVLASVETRSIKDVGYSVTVPFDPLARIMYYLRCIYGCCEDLIPWNCVCWEDYAKKTYEEKNLIMSYARQYHPDRMLRFCFCIVPDDAFEEPNKFWEIGTSTTVFGMACNGYGSEIVVEGRTCRYQIL